MKENFEETIGPSNPEARLRVWFIDKLNFSPNGEDLLEAVKHMPLNRTLDILRINREVPDGLNESSEEKEARNAAISAASAELEKVFNENECDGIFNVKYVEEDYAKMKANGLELVEAGELVKAGIAFSICEMYRYCLTGEYIEDLNFEVHDEAFLRDYFSK